MCSPTRELIFGGETMSFSKIVGRTGLKYIYIYITGRLVFMQKKKKMVK
jgi:hypothetical protein